MIELPGTNPFHRGGWSGRIISVDGTSDADFTDEEPFDVVASWESGGEYDGDVVGIARLHDGRYIAWETDYGPTGDGFYCDAYGGNADIFIGATVEAVLWKGLSADSRMRLGYPAEQVAPVEVSAVDPGCVTWIGMLVHVPLRIQCPTTGEFADYTTLPTTDVPCPCKNPNHWFVKYEKETP